MMMICLAQWSVIIIIILGMIISTGSSLSWKGMAGRSNDYYEIQRCKITKTIFIFGRKSAVIILEISHVDLLGDEFTFHAWPCDDRLR